MSERKDAEIKFRIAGSEKAAWQQYAESAQLALSELIRREVNEGIRQNEAKQTTEFVAIETWTSGPTGCTSCPDPLPCHNLRVEAGLESAAAPQEDVSTSDEVAANVMAARELTSEEIAQFTEGAPAPWTFEARNG